MISGRETLNDLQRALAAEQKRLRELDARLSQSNEELLQLDTKRSTELQTLARLRLQFLSTGDRPQQHDDTDRTVLALLGDRNRAYDEVQRRLSDLEAERERLESRQAELADERERLAEQISAAELATQQRLQADPTYQQQLAAAHEADRVAAQAEAKATQSEQERESKGEAYRSDRLFTYLWNRHYGTSDYRGSGLVRWLDGKVARLIGYADARPNYARLQEIPVRLRDHAERARERADAAFAELQELDVAGRVDDGIPELEKRLDELQARLDELQEERADLAQRNAKALADLETFAHGSDESYRKAVTLLRNELEDAPLQMLRSEALATPSPDDDVIVARLRDLTRQHEKLARTVDEMKESAAQYRQRLGDLEQLRGAFTRSGMDAPNSGFKDGRAVSSALGQFLNGLLTAEAFWRVLNQQRVLVRTSSDPDFGSGGFGRGTVWGGGRGFPRDDGPDIDVGDLVGGILGGLLGGAVRGGFDRGGFGGGFGGGFPGGGLGGGSRPGGGGFRTGGRVGGGGFKTGGKF